jgi:hypothetical protein
MSVSHRMVVDYTVFRSFRMQPFQENHAVFGTTLTYSNESQPVLGQAVTQTNLVYTPVSIIHREPTSTIQPDDQLKRWLLCPLMHINSDDGKHHHASQ